MGDSNQSDTEARTKAVICEALDIEPSEMEGNDKNDAHLIHDLGGSSLGLVQLVMELEEEFDISIPEGEAENLVTFNEIYGYLQGKL